MASDRHIDDAIDQAVRDIMRAEPRAGLRGRVLTEIEQPSRRFQFRPVFAGAAFLAVAAVLVALLLRPAPSSAPESIGARQDQPVPAPVPTAAAEAKAPAAAASPAATDAAGRAPQPALRTPERDRVVFPPRGMVSAANVPVDAERGVTLVYLPDSAVGTADAKTPEPPILVPRIEIAPISIAPIVITPIPRSR